MSLSTAQAFSLFTRTKREVLVLNLQIRAHPIILRNILSMALNSQERLEQLIGREFLFREKIQCLVVKQFACLNCNNNIYSYQQMKYKKQTSKKKKGITFHPHFNKEREKNQVPTGTIQQQKGSQGIQSQNKDKSFSIDMLESPPVQVIDQWEQISFEHSQKQQKGSQGVQSQNKDKSFSIDMLESPPVQVIDQWEQISFEHSQNLLKIDQPAQVPKNMQGSKNVRGLFKTPAKEYDSNQLKVFNLHFEKNCRSSDSLKTLFESIPSKKHLQAIQKKKQLSKILYRLQQNIRPKRNGSKNPKIFTIEQFCQNLVYVREQDIQYTVLLIKFCRSYLPIFEKEIKSNTKIDQNNLKIVPTVKSILDEISQPIFECFRQKFKDNEEAINWIGQGYGR